MSTSISQKYIGQQVSHQAVTRWLDSPKTTRAQEVARMVKRAAGRWRARFNLSMWGKIFRRAFAAGRLALTVSLLLA